MCVNRARSSTLFSRYMLSWSVLGVRLVVKTSLLKIVAYNAVGMYIVYNFEIEMVN